MTRTTRRRPTPNPSLAAAVVLILMGLAGVARPATPPVAAPAAQTAGR